MSYGHNTISLIENQIQRHIEQLRPPQEIRSVTDIGYQFDHNTLEIYELHPNTQLRSSPIKASFAKIKYLKCKGCWEIYWKKNNGKWETYQTENPLKTIDDVFNFIKKDPKGCFFG